MQHQNFEKVGSGQQQEVKELMDKKEQAQKFLRLNII